MCSSFEGSSFEFKVFGRFLSGIDKCLLFLQQRKTVVSGLPVFSALDEHEPGVEFKRLDFVGHRSCIDSEAIADFHDLFVSEGYVLERKGFFCSPFRYTVSFVFLVLSVANPYSSLSMLTRSVGRVCV